LILFKDKAGRGEGVQIAGEFPAFDGNGVARRFAAHVYRGGGGNLAGNRDS